MSHTMPLANDAGSPQSVPPGAQAPLAVVGFRSVLEFGPVLVAAKNAQPGTVVTASGGVPSLWAPSAGLERRSSVADLAGNAETQALRTSLAHPDLRIVMTVTEGLYRVVGRRSAGIASVADLRGKRIATFANSSAAFYLHEVLQTAGLSESDVMLISVTLPRSADAVIDGQADALVMWEPEAERAAQTLGADAVTFQPQGIGYREIYSLNAKAGDLANPTRRPQVVAFLREVLTGCRRAQDDPAEMQTLLAQRTGHDPALIRASWRHYRFPCSLPTDLLDVLVDEEQWLAAADHRTPRGREQLATLIDRTVLDEALAR